MTLERVAVPFEIKAVSDDGPVMTFEGYGSVFGTIDSYNDEIVKGAFKGTLKEWKARKKLPKLLLQHGGGGMFGMGSVDDLVPIGKWDEMYEDEHGLFARGHLFNIDTDRTKATYAAMKEGELDGLSIGFNTKKSKTNEETGIRQLLDQRRLHGDARRLALAADERRRVGTSVFEQDVGNTGDPLVAQLGSRPLGDRHGAVHIDANQDVAHILRIEFDRLHLADPDPAITHLPLQTETGDILAGDHRVFFGRFVPAAEPPDRRQRRQPKQQGEQAGQQGMRTVFHG